MALIDGTYTRYAAKGLREDLTDAIYNISPTDTPFMSMAGRGKASQTLHEWQTDSLAAVDTANKHLEGDQASYTTPSASVRVGNYTQILTKTGSVSGTLEAVDKAGRKSEKAYQQAKRSKELKRDFETILLQAQAGDAGGVGTARTWAALNAWVKTNCDVGTSGGNPTYSAGVPAAVRTDGTGRAFTETILKSVLSKVWVSGGNPRILMVGAFNKAAASAFDGIAVQNVNVMAANAAAMPIIGAADIYVGNFSTLRIVPNRFQRAEDGWVLDPDLVEVDYLRPFFTEDLAKVGDAENFEIIVEATLKVKQEAGLGLCADLTTT